MSDAAQPNAAQTVREDIAFVRAMVEQGASGPIFGGSILLAAGLIYATASTATWFVLTRMPSEIGHWAAPIWASAVTTQAVVMTIIILRLRGNGQGLAAANRSNRAFATIWNGVGLAIMSCLASFFLTAWLAHIPAVFAGSPAAILALYGVGWMMTAASSKERWTWTIALLSFLFAIASGALAGSVNLPLLFALALLLLLAAPGVLLILRSRVRP
ncbi:MAG: hypothetical protein ACXU82_18230 [Caulobacteraceae bacterium]